MANTRNLAPAKSEGDVSFVTAVDLASYLYCFVTLDTNELAVVTNMSSAFVAGIAQDYPVPAPTTYPAALSNVTVRTTGLSLLVVGQNNVAFGDLLESDANGKAYTAVSGKKYNAQALSSGVPGDRILVRLVSGIM